MTIIRQKLVLICVGGHGLLLNLLDWINRGTYILQQNNLIIASLWNKSVSPAEMSHDAKSKIVILKAQGVPK